MQSAVAILTYRRENVLRETLSGLIKHCGQYPIAIFEDAGQTDGTETLLKGPNPKLIETRKDLLAEVYDGSHLGPNVTVFLGTQNLGVSGNSNRALRWFEEKKECNHLCLLNDDLHVLGDFVNFYARGHEELGVGLWCFSDFDHDPSYAFMTVNSRGWEVKMLSRMTGIMMSLTRPMVEKIGYYDTRFHFGNEHCEYTIRARFAGFIKLDGMDQNCLDLLSTPPLLKHQECATSVTGPDRARYDQQAIDTMAEIAAQWHQEPKYKPFRLRVPQVSGHSGVGIPTEHLGHYALLDIPA